MLERSQIGERALLVHAQLNATFIDDALDELQELATTAGAQVIECVTTCRRVPEPKFFIGGGKADEIREQISNRDIELVIFNHPLSPSQERNLESHFDCRVLDRTGLILDIFAQRAQTHEGKLQVELAQLRHLSTRLVRGWTHLERQKGGIGLRGPGETQLETDRRLIGKRIQTLNAKLDKVSRQREQERRNRNKRNMPGVSLVGYTNAGKSTLFNQLTRSSVYIADQLFATLDPIARRLEMIDGPAVVITDTVGFIRHLPHELIAAFRSTLSETRDTDLLLHVIDSYAEGKRDRMETVNVVLEEIGAQDVPVIEVFNKCDLTAVTPRIDYDQEGKPRRVHLSAVTGDGIELLEQAIVEFFRHDMVDGWVTLPNRQGKLRAQLFALGAVRQEETIDEGWRLHVALPRMECQRLMHSEGMTLPSS